MRRQMRNMFRRTVILAVVLGLCFTSTTLTAMAAGPAGNVEIRGVVFSGERQTIVAGARVYAVHLDTKQVFQSSPSNDKGEYDLTGLPYGYYDLAVETSDGLFLANRVINAPAGERVEMSMILGPPQPEDTEWWSAEPDRRIPGLDRVPDGVARIVEGIPRKSRLVEIASGKPTATGASTRAATSGTRIFGGGKSGWALPLLAAGGLAGLIILLDDDDDNEDGGSSPF